MGKYCHVPFISAHFRSLPHFRTSSLLSSSKFLPLFISAIPIIPKSRHPLLMFQNHSPFTCLPYIAISTFQTVPDSLCRSVPYSDSVFVPDLSFVIAPLPLVYKPLYNLGVEHSEYFVFSPKATPDTPLVRSPVPLRFQLGPTLVVPLRTPLPYSPSSEIVHVWAEGHST